MYIAVLLILLFKLPSWMPKDLTPWHFKGVGIIIASIVGVIWHQLSGLLSIDGTVPTAGRGHVKVRAAGGIAISLVVLYLWFQESPPKEMPKDQKIGSITQNTSGQGSSNVAGVQGDVHVDQQNKQNCEQDTKPSTGLRK